MTAINFTRLSLPSFFPYLTIAVHPLATHDNDPCIALSSDSSIEWLLAI